MITLYLSFPNPRWSIFPNNSSYTLGGRFWEEKSLNLGALDPWKPMIGYIYRKYLAKALSILCYPPKELLIAYFPTKAVKRELLYTPSLATIFIAGRTCERRQELLRKGTITKHNSRQKTIYKRPCFVGNVTSITQVYLTL